LDPYYPVFDSVSEQPHELKYEAQKERTSAKAVESAKKEAGTNKRGAVEKTLENKNSKPLRVFPKDI
jgi:hypothetical protein